MRRKRNTYTFGFPHERASIKVYKRVNWFEINNGVDIPRSAMALQTIGNS
jgi:hypothetical protein